ncbi:MAG: substrate-binding domain-containing protein [Anaerolineae bacterium]|nr:substrate-binding domain-containing protein [Anaerolineae bacterium]
MNSGTQQVGSNQYEIGVRAAAYFATQVSTGKFAVIEGLPGYAARQRTLGFETALADTDLEVVASVAANWDSQQAVEAATTIIAQHPDIRGFYCNNDIMALGVSAAVRASGKSGQIMVIGTDGIEPAYAAIRAGTLTATVDTFPNLTGHIALEMITRILEGQAVPRVVYSTQNIVTLDNVENPLP